MQQHSDGLPDQQPHAARWALPARREAVTQARDHVRELLTTDGRPVAPATLRDGLLVVSELVTNAVLHTPGACVLHVTYEDGLLVIAVSDSSPDLPVPRVPDLTTVTGGFGWRLLKTLTTCIDVRLNADGGKTITAVLPRRGA